MLTELFIQDIVLIERLSLSLNTGLTALTGETGAGKSIMLDSLGLATGGRAEKGLVRQGARQGVVSATFDVSDDHEVWHLLADNGIAHEDEQGGHVILRRVQDADGRARAFINDQPVSVTLLRQVGESLIEVHGQHAGQGFLHAGAHRGLLDEFGGLTKQADSVAIAWRIWKEAEEKLSEHEEDKARAIREADYLRHVADELEKLAPQPGEESFLANRRIVLMNAEKIAGDLSEAVGLLNETSLEDRLSSVLGRVERTLEWLEGEATTNLQSVAERIDTVLTELQEARSAVSEAVAEFEFDQDELDQTEERLFALRAAARKHNTTPDKLDALLDDVRHSLAMIEEGEADFATLQKTASVAKSEFLAQARKLSEARHKTAKKLDKAVAGELEPLKLGRATFQAAVTTEEETPGVHGIDRVQFMISTNPGAPMGPLKQIASGGELSRFVLALKAALMAQENRTVIIFDEVDAGIGGAVADAVGERLSKLAADAQVMVVTHSPQVAARAGAHFMVAKSGKKKMVTKVFALEEDERVEEIARMLSGASVTAEARAAATSLLKASKETRDKKKAKAA